MTEGSDFSFSKVREDLRSNTKPHCKEIRAQNMDDVILRSLVMMPTDIFLGQTEYKYMYSHLGN